MSRSAAALVGATLVVGCTTVGTFDMLATSDRDLFSACAPSLLDVVCKDGDVVARESCLESRGAAYGQLHSPRMRRSWLIANGCPESTVDAPPKAEIVAQAAPPPAPPEPAPPPPPPAPAKPEPSPPVAHTEPLPAKAESPAEPLPVTAMAAPPPAKAEPPPAPPPLAKAEPTASLTLAKAHPTPPRPAAPPVGSFSERERPDIRERRLRDIIIAHGREMKGCVDRQLKLMPDLRADGLLVIDVDADGTVPRAELQGADLAGTALESCLRTIASRWRFPSSGRAYRIEAPLKVSGS